jgi:hypothetical protein
LFEHDLFGKPVPTFPDHASMPSPKSRPGPLACEAHNRIKEAGYRRKQEGAQSGGLESLQPFDIPLKFAPVRRRRWLGDV